MSNQRLSLINYDVLRELCDHCRKERFHFVPMGAVQNPSRCAQCGAEARMADMSDTSVFRLVTQEDGDVVVVPIIRRA